MNRFRLWFLVAAALMPAGAPARVLEDCSAMGRVIDRVAEQASSCVGDFGRWNQLDESVREAIEEPLSRIRHARDWHERPYADWNRERRGRRLPEGSFAEFYLEEVLDGSEANTFLALYSKLEDERLWRYVHKVQWTGGTGVLVFTPNVKVRKFRALLAGRGYGDWWNASRGARWGVRSRYAGPELHFKAGDAYGSVHVHIDVRNPGDPASGEVTAWYEEVGPAIGHWLDDEWDRADRYASPSHIMDALCRDGVTVHYVN